MSRRPRRNHSPTFKAKEAWAAVKGETMLTEFAQLYNVHAIQITSWRARLSESAAGVFGSDNALNAAEPAIDVKTLHLKMWIGFQSATFPPHFGKRQLRPGERSSHKTDSTILTSGGRPRTKRV